jgi:hypothetical protein
METAKIVKMTLPVHGLTSAVTHALQGEHWEAFERQGFLHLGPVCSSGEALALSGVAQVPGFFDLSGRADDEGNRMLLELLHHPLFHEVCDRIYGLRGAVMVFRSKIEMRGGNASDDLGSWCQNAGQLQNLDRDELATVLVCLDASARDVVEAIPGSHRLGLLNPDGGMLSQRDSERHGPEDKAVRVHLEPGHALLLHKWLIHRPAKPNADSRNCTAEFWFVDGRARSIVTGYHELPEYTGKVDRKPYPCVSLLLRECEELQKRFKETERYALSLEQERMQWVGKTPEVSGP